MVREKNAVVRVTTERLTPHMSQDSRINQYVRNRIAELLKKTGNSARQCALALHLSPSYFPAMMMKETVPSNNTLEDFCEYVGITIVEFYEPYYAHRKKTTAGQIADILMGYDKKQAIALLEILKEEDLESVNECIKILKGGKTAYSEFYELLKDYSKKEIQVISRFFRSISPKEAGLVVDDISDGRSYSYKLFHELIKEDKPTIKLLYSLLHSIHKLNPPTKNAICALIQHSPEKVETFMKSVGKWEPDESRYDDLMELMNGAFSMDKATLDSLAVITCRLAEVPVQKGAGKNAGARSAGAKRGRKPAAKTAAGKPAVVPHT